MRSSMEIPREITKSMRSSMEIPHEIAKRERERERKRERKQATDRYIVGKIDGWMD